jgi:hypothetical protein
MADVESLVANSLPGVTQLRRPPLVEKLEKLEKLVKKLNP